MGQPGYIIDTNIAISSLANTLPPGGVLFVNTLDPVISVITKIELLGWYNVAPSDLLTLQNFTAKATVLSLQPDIVTQTIRLRQQHRMKTPDAIIAATAMIHSLILVTRNVSDFRQIPGIRLINPFDI
jgi:predicted nucleic acid-binding protein